MMSADTTTTSRTCWLSNQHGDGYDLVDAYPSGRRIGVVYLDRQDPSSVGLVLHIDGEIVARTWALQQIAEIETVRLAGRARACKLDDLPQGALYSDDGSGDPLADGPTCVTCGALAVWGTHQVCDREDGSLIVWPGKGALRHYVDRYYTDQPMVAAAGEDHLPDSLDELREIIGRHGYRLASDDERAVAELAGWR